MIEHSLEEITKMALSLSKDDREKLLGSLLASLDMKTEPAPPPERTSGIQEYDEYVVIGGIRVWKRGFGP